MPNLVTFEIPRPKSAKDFESLCLDLWRQMLGDPKTRPASLEEEGFHITGRHSVDLGLVAVYCCFKHKPLTISHIRARVESAHQLKPKLSRFVVATTGPRDARAQEFTRELSTRHGDADLFLVTIMSWDDIQHELKFYPELIYNYFPPIGRELVGLTRIVRRVDERIRNQGMPRYLSPPQNSSNFEELCCDLWRKIWGDSYAQRHGRLGQALHGVDIVGLITCENRWAAVQCKTKSQAGRRVLAHREIEQEVEKALSFNPRLSRYTIATTAPRDAATQHFVLEMNDRLRAHGEFELDICFWEGIVRLLNNYPDVVAWNFQLSDSSSVPSDAKASYYSCFISYSHEDEMFAWRLFKELKARGIECWMDKHQLLPGDDIYAEIDRGIRQWDKVLLCCSQASLASWWVDSEINSAFKKEQDLMRSRVESLQGRRILTLIPLNLDGYLFSGRWKSGKAEQVTSRLAADFTGWEQDESKFQEEFGRLMKALRADQGARSEPPKPKL